MKLFNKIIFCTMFLVWSTSSNAGWYHNKSIQYLYAGEIGSRYAVKLIGSQPNPDLCGSSFDLVIEPNNTKLKSMWAMLLAAYMANKPVNIYLSGCSVGKYKLPIITDISLGAF